MPDTPTPETPAELAATIMRMADVLAYVHETTVRKNHHGPRCRTELHAAIYVLRDLATLAASSTAPDTYVLQLLLAAGHVTEAQVGQARAIAAHTPGAPAAAERKPLTDEQVDEGRIAWLHGPAGVHPSAFVAGARFAERAHGIPAAPAGSEGE
jgi:hypothetical protein